MPVLGSYDHPNALVRREQAFKAGGGTDNDVHARFTHFAKCQLVAVHGVVSVAGTGTAANAFIIYNGTTSIGVLTMGTAVIGTESSVALNSSLAALTVINVDQGADIVGEVALSFEYQVDYDAIIT